MTLRVSTSAETAELFRSVFDARMNRRRSGRPWRPPQTPTADGISAFRELVLSKVGRLMPRSQKDLRESVEEEWGTVDRRTVARAIEWLLDRGDIVRARRAVVCGETPRAVDGYLRAPRRRPT